MPSDDLDKYLEDIGINVEDDVSEPQLPEVRDMEAPIPAPLNLLPEGAPVERAETFLVNVLLNLDPAYSVEVSERDEGELAAVVKGGDHGKLIGRGGRTLAALEYLTNAVLNREEGSSLRVDIDVGGYKRRRDERLRNAALQAATRVRESGVPVELEPMNGAERRIIHLTLADEPDVYTESAGEGRDRRVVVHLRE